MPSARAQEKTESTLVVTLEAQPVVMAPVSTAEPSTSTVNVNVNPATTTVTPPAPESATLPFTYLAFGALTLICVALLFNLPVLLRIVAPLIPADQATLLFKAMIPLIADAVLKVAAQTPTTLDEGLAIAALRQQGYTVTTLPNGTYHVEGPKATVPAGTAGAPTASGVGFSDPSAG